MANLQNYTSWKIKEFVCDVISMDGRYLHVKKSPVTADDQLAEFVNTNRIDDFKVLESQGDGKLYIKIIYR